MHLRSGSLYQTLLCFTLSHLLRRANAGSSSNNVDTSVYGMSMQRDWLYESNVVNLKLEGCVWGYVDGDEREDMGCMDDSSEDGTTYWYMMANCRRAQVAYSLHAASSGTNCKNGNWKETFITKGGVAEFAYTMSTYGYNSPISSDDVSSIPTCESDGNGLYYGAGCDTSGKFTIDRFTDQYCTQYYDTYDTLSNFNYQMKSLSSCYNVFNVNSDESIYNSLAYYLLQESGTCSSSESSLCKDSNFVSNSGSSNGVGQRTSSRLSSGSPTFVNKMKYALGGSMLLGSVVMFIGILFTNRKKRRAMMHRKFKNKSSDKKKKKSSRSASSRKRSSSSKKSSGVFA